MKRVLEPLAKRHAFKHACWRMPFLILRRIAKGDRNAYLELKEPNLTEITEYLTLGEFDDQWIVEYNRLKTNVSLLPKTALQEIVDGILPIELQNEGRKLSPTKVSMAQTLLSRTNVVTLEDLLDTVTQGTGLDIPPIKRDEELRKCSTKGKIWSYGTALKTEAVATFLAGDPERVNRIRKEKDVGKKGILIKTEVNAHWQEVVSLKQTVLEQQKKLEEQQKRTDELAMQSQIASSPQQLVLIGSEDCRRYVQQYVKSPPQYCALLDMLFRRRSEIVEWSFFVSLVYAVVADVAMGVYWRVPLRLRHSRFIGIKRQSGGSMHLLYYHQLQYSTLDFLSTQTLLREIFVVLDYPKELAEVLYSFMTLSVCPPQYAGHSHVEKQKRKQYAELANPIRDPWKEATLKSLDVMVNFEAPDPMPGFLPYKISDAQEVLVGMFLGQSVSKNVDATGKEKLIYYWYNESVLKPGKYATFLINDPGPHIVRVSEKIPSMWTAYPDRSWDCTVRHMAEVSQARFQMDVPEGMSAYRVSELPVGVYWITIACAYSSRVIGTRPFIVARNVKSRTTGDSTLVLDAFEQLYDDPYGWTDMESDLATIVVQANGKVRMSFKHINFQVEWEWKYAYPVSEIPCFCFEGQFQEESQMSLKHCSRCMKAYTEYWEKQLPCFNELHSCDQCMMAMKRIQDCCICWQKLPENRVPIY